MSEFGIGCLYIDDTSLTGGINPVNNQHLRVKNNNATTKTRKAAPDPMGTGAKNTVPLDMGGEKPVLGELHIDGLTLEDWKCYLDSCATYHNFFVREFLDRVYSGKTAMNGSGNAGTVTNNTRGWYG